MFGVSDVRGVFRCSDVRMFKCSDFQMLRCSGIFQFAGTWLAERYVLALQGYCCWCSFSCLPSFLILSLSLFFFDLSLLPSLIFFFSILLFCLSLLPSFTNISFSVFLFLCLSLLQWYPSSSSPSCLSCFPTFSFIFPWLNLSFRSLFPPSSFLPLLLEPFLSFLIPPFLLYRSFA